MSEKGRVSLYQEQKKAKPKIEDVINDLLEGGRKQAALDFVSYIKSLRMTPQWASANSWAVNYKNKRICYIKVGDYVAGGVSWYIRPAITYDDALIAFAANENLEKIMLDSIHFCHHCGKCSPGKHAALFGKEFDNVCCSPIDFEFHNPDASTLDCAKKIVDFKRNVISGNI
jgi:hypothetical protein